MRFTAKYIDHYALIATVFGFVVFNFKFIFQQLDETFHFAEKISFNILLVVVLALLYIGLNSKVNK